MKADFLFAGLNWNRIMQKKQCQKKVHSMDDALKTRGIIYLNVETGFLFATPHQNFWLHAWAVPGLPVRPAWAITAAYHRCLAVCKCCPWRTCTAVYCSVGSSQTVVIKVCSWRDRGDDNRACAHGLVRAFTSFIRWDHLLIISMHLLTWFSQLVMSEFMHSIFRTSHWGVNVVFV